MDNAIAVKKVTNHYAVQFTAKSFNYICWQHMRTWNPKYNEKNKCIVFNNRGVIDTLKLNHWFITNADGSYTTVSDEQFRKQYST